MKLKFLKEGEIQGIKGDVYLRRLRETGPWPQIIVSYMVHFQFVKYPFTFSIFIK